MAVEGKNMKDFERKKTDRGEELSLPPMDIFCSHYVSKLLAFTVKRKVFSCLCPFAYNHCLLVL